MYALGHGKFETLKHNSTSANLIPVGIRLAIFIFIFFEQFIY